MLDKKEEAERFLGGDRCLICVLCAVTCRHELPIIRETNRRPVIKKFSDSRLMLSAFHYHFLFVTPRC